MNQKINQPKVFVITGDFDSYRRVNDIITKSDCVNPWKRNDVGYRQNYQAITDINNIGKNNDIPDLIIIASVNVCKTEIDKAFQGVGKSFTHSFELLSDEDAGGIVVEAIKKGVFPEIQSTPLINIAGGMFSSKSELETLSNLGVITCDRVNNLEQLIQDILGEKIKLYRDNNILSLPQVVDNSQSIKNVLERKWTKTQGDSLFTQFDSNLPQLTHDLAALGIPEISVDHTNNNNIVVSGNHHLSILANLGADFEGASRYKDNKSTPDNSKPLDDIKHKSVRPTKIGNALRRMPVFHTFADAIDNFAKTTGIVKQR